MGSISVLIVDDDERFASALEALLDADGRFDVVGWASNGAEAISLVAKRRPRVVMMDLAMPVLDGVAATRAIRGSFPETRVVVVTGADAPDGLEQALAAGAAAHLTKGRLADDLLDAVAAAAGEAASTAARD